MKKATAFGAGIVGVLAIAGVAFASAPTITLDPIGPLDYATFPQVYDVTGTINHSPNVSSVVDLTLFIDDVQEGATQNPTGVGTSEEFSLPWNILSPGTYDVKVTARHGGDTGEDTQEDVVITQTTVVITECPAAPAIAGAYLRSIPVKEGSAKWKQVIKAVAGETGSKGSLWAANACEAGYPQEVRDFVDSSLL